MASDSIDFCGRGVRVEVAIDLECQVLANRPDASTRKLEQEEKEMDRLSIPSQLREQGFDFQE
jgi:hypothetical protein